MKTYKRLIEHSQMCLLMCTLDWIQHALKKRLTPPQNWIQNLRQTICTHTHTTCHNYHFGAVVFTRIKLCDRNVQSTRDLINSNYINMPITRERTTVLVTVHRSHNITHLIHFQVQTNRLRSQELVWPAQLTICFQSRLLQTSRQSHA